MYTYNVHVYVHVHVSAGKIFPHIFQHVVAFIYLKCRKFPAKFSLFVSYLIWTVLLLVECNVTYHNESLIRCSNTAYGVWCFLVCVCVCVCVCERERERESERERVCVCACIYVCICVCVHVCVCVCVCV